MAEGRCGGALKIFVYYIGRAKDQNANALAADFAQRSSRFASVEVREIQPAKFDIGMRHPSARKIYLDPAGKEMDSASFATLISQAEMHSQDLVFLIGGHEGLTDGQRSEAGLLLSLGKMTWPHELARVLLLEQIYRAFAILRNLPYVR
jgi:23S rRNA (pseudouridine1915-N3)-methyltransferase